MSLVSFGPSLDLYILQLVPDVLPQVQNTQSGSHLTQPRTAGELKTDTHDRWMSFPKL